MSEEHNELKPIGSAVSANPVRPSINSGRLERAEAMAVLAQRLFSFYHEQELAANPEIFLAGVVELFCHYSREAVLRAVSPTFGLPAKFKFPPRLAEIKEFLDDLSPEEPPRRYPVLPRDPPIPQVKPRPEWKSYAEFLLMSASGAVKPRPVGRFEK